MSQNQPQVVSADALPTTATESEDATSVAPAPANGMEQRLLEEDLLVEDVSIDGMCGVY